jgi:hypothetical protein
MHQVEHFDTIYGAMMVNTGGHSNARWAVVGGAKLSGDVAYPRRAGWALIAEKIAIGLFEQPARRA